MTLLAFSAAFVAGGLAGQPAKAAQTIQHSSQARQSSELQASDVSSARRYRDVRVYDDGDAYRYQRGYYGDPSIGYYPSLRRYQSAGRCIIDLGYGRYQFCN